MNRAPTETFYRIAMFGPEALVLALAMNADPLRPLSQVGDQPAPATTTRARHVASARERDEWAFEPCSDECRYRRVAFYSGPPPGGWMSIHRFCPRHGGVPWSEAAEVARVQLLRWLDKQTVIEPARPSPCQAGPTNDVATWNLAACALLGDWYMADADRDQATVGARYEWFIHHVVGIDVHTGLLRVEDPLEVAITATAASECYDLARMPHIERTARDAIGKLIESREKSAGWECREDHGAECDLEITAWSLLACKSASAAGVLESTCEQDVEIRAWLDRIAEVPDADRSPATTALMLWCRVLVEQDPAQSAPMRAEIERLAQHIPQWVPECFERDRALWLWGSYVARPMGGDDIWESWSRALGDALSREIEAWSVEGGRRPSRAELTTALLASQTPFRYSRIYGIR